MSAAAAATADAEPKKKGSKKLIIIIAAVAVLLLGGGGAAVFVMKKKAAEAAAAEEEGGTDTAHKPAPKPAKKAEHKQPPTFVPLDAFTVNLADRDKDRYAQIGVTLEIDDPKTAEELKTFMPAIRNGILMVLAHKTSAELLEREGKEKLAREIRRESVRPLGIDLSEDDEEAADDEEEGASKKKKKKKKRAEVYSPVTQVHFSNFIIQ